MEPSKQIWRGYRKTPLEASGLGGCREHDAGCGCCQWLSLFCTSGKSCFYDILLLSSSPILQVGPLKVSLVHGCCFELLGTWFGLALVKL